MSCLVGFGRIVKKYDCVEIGLHLRLHKRLQAVTLFFQAPLWQTSELKSGEKSFTSNLLLIAPEALRVANESCQTYQFGKETVC